MKTDLRGPTPQWQVLRPHGPAPVRIRQTRGIAMGLLIKGKWVDQWYDTESSKGEFIRSQSQFRNWVTTYGGAGPTGEDGFRAEPGRYHLYVSLACPWAHRTLIFRVLKGLEKMISVSSDTQLMP